MSRSRASIRMFTRMALIACSVALVSVMVQRLPAGFFGGGFNNRAVGGISIDAQGVVKNTTVGERSELLTELRQRIHGSSDEMKAEGGLRKISLRKLQAALQHARETGEGMTEELGFLGGIQRIEYVLVYPEKQDIVIAGPAEDWVVRDSDAVVVGKKSGLPVLHLDDLLLAFRTVEAARTEGLSCSIDPTEQGVAALQALLDRVPVGKKVDPTQLEPAMREAFGPQMVKLTGVPETSRGARIMLGADYHMKRIAMNLDPSPVAGLKSYLHMVNATGGKNVAQSRWWLACDYDPIQRSEDGLAFRISGRGFKAMTEEEALDKDGTRTRTGKANKLAQKWADNFTEHLAELSTKDSVFGDLRNFMDLCVVAALIEQSNLADLAHCDLSVIKGTVGSVPVVTSDLIPKSIDPHCSFLRAANGWVVSASGGVQIDSWGVAEKQIVDAKLDKVREESEAAVGKPWWWN